MNGSREIALALGKNLQQLMEHHQLSQAQLSKKAGVGQSTLSNLLDLTSPLEINPRASTISQLAAYFGLPAWQLLIPEQPLELLLNDGLARLLEGYKDLPPKGRQQLVSTLDAEQRYAAMERQTIGRKASA